jgi:LPXTG-motif cell wall-anchored protein
MDVHRMPRGLRGALRRGIAATAVTGLVTLGAAAFTAAPANAWTGSVTGAAECSDGNWVVAWTVKNSEKVPAALAYKGKTPADKVDIAPAVPAGGEVTGGQTLPGKTTGAVEATFTLTWPDAGKPPVSEDFKGTVTLPSKPCVKDVTRAPKPSAHIKLDCDTFKIFLKNEGTAPARFFVLVKIGDDKWIKDGPFLVKPGRTLVLPPKGSEDSVARAEPSKSAPAEEEPPTIAVKVISGGKVLDSAKLDLADCEEESTPPSASPSETSAAPAPVVNTPSPAAEESSLPVTGASLGGLIAAAFLVLAAGIGMVVFTRRRKNV